MAIPFRSNTSKDKKNIVELEQSEQYEETVLEETTPLLNFILKHFKVVISGLIFCVVIIIAIGSWSWYLKQQESIAEKELGRILVKPISMEQLEELEEFFKKAPTSLKKGLLLQMAFIAIELEDIKKASDFYGLLYTKDYKGVAGILGGLNQADLLQKLGSWHDSLNVLNSLEKVASTPLLSAVYEAQAICAEQLGEKDIAITAYKKLIDELTASGNDAVFYESRIAALTKN